MSNEVFVDSSILIEYRKGNKTEILEALLVHRGIDLYINQSVVSEYLFHHLALFGGKSPLAIKEKDLIPEIFAKHDPASFLKLFSLSAQKDEIIELSINYMQNFNLLPNDALILSSCKSNGIIALASFDVDFVYPCAKENIHLIQDLQSLEAFLAG